MSDKKDAILQWLEEDEQLPQAMRDLEAQGRERELIRAEAEAEMADNAEADSFDAKAYIERNTKDGVPLDIHSGLGPKLRAKMSFEGNAEKQVEWLKQQKDIIDARLSDDGAVIARIKGDDGKPKDVFLDERGITKGDLADMAGDTPQMAAQTAAAIYTGGTSLLAQALIQAGVGFGTGSAQDALVRGATGRDIDPAEILANRSIGAAVDTAIPLVPGAAKRVAQKLIAPFGGTAGTLEREAARAADRFKITLSAGQRTGSPILSRAETFASKLPGGGALVDQAKQQDEAIRAAQEIIIGAPRSKVPSEAEIGESAGKVLAGNRMAAESVVDTSFDQAQSAAQSAIKSLINAGTTPRNITTTEAGGLVRTRVKQLRDEFKAQAKSLYDNVYKAAGGDFVEVDLSPVRELLKEIKENSSDAARKVNPGVQRVLSVTSSLPTGGEKQVASPILDQFGRTIMQIEKMPNGLPLNQVTELRSLVNDQIGKSEAIGGIPDRYLKRLSAAITDSIEGTISKAENGEVKTALKAANDFYRTNAPKFEQRGLAELFPEATESGFIDDSRIVKRIFDGQGDVDLLRRYQSVLGKDSAEYKALAKAGLNRVLEDSTQVGSRYIEPGSFISRLSAMDSEVRKSLLGASEEQIVKLAGAMKLQKGAKISTMDLQEILSGTAPNVADAFRDAVAKQARFDQAYNTRLMRQLTDGQFNPTELNPDEFVSRFVSNASAKEAKMVMDTIRRQAPQVAEDIRKRTIVNVLDRAAPKSVPEDAVSDAMGNIDYTKLISTVRDDSEKLTAIVGVDTMQDLLDLTKIEAVRAKGREMGGQAGQLVYSNVLASLMSAEIKQVPKIIKNRVLASLLTAPGFKQWLTQTTLIPATPRARMAVMASPPFLRAIIDEFRNEPDELGQIMDAIRLGPDAEQVRKDGEEAALLDYLNSEADAAPAI